MNLHYKDYLRQWRLRLSFLKNTAHQAQTLRPRIFRPLAFPPRQTMPKHMVNSVINEETGASLEYRHLVNYASTFTIWNEAAANKFGLLAQGDGNRIDGSNTIFLSHTKPSQKETLLPTDGSSSTYVPTNLKSTWSASL
jgi:hypothetical protein